MFIADDKSRSKRMMVEEILELKNDIENQKKDLMAKDNNLTDVQVMLDRKEAELKNSEHKAEVFRNQVSYK